VDTTGVGLHKRGYKLAMGKAPLRETMAALALRGCGYNGTETVIDPMCGSGTFLIEAAQISRNIMAGGARTFAFEKLASYDSNIVQNIKDNWKQIETSQKFYGSDRNVNVIEFSKANAERGNVLDMCDFKPLPLSKIECPKGPPGLVIVNPPYGARIGKKKDLFALYNSFGNIMRDKFTGWRVGMITSDANLAEATKLPWLKTSPPIAHGGLKVKLFKTEALL
jgi:putative N6-adenine-specific DNA methylase